MRKSQTRGSKLTEDVEDLIQTLEEIRKEEYPEIPEGLVRDIVEIEFGSVEEDNDAPNRIDDLVESILDEEE